MSNKTIFKIVRFGFYTFLWISELILLSVVPINCSGCIFCGMTRAFLCCLKFDFVSAYNYNQLILPFGIALLFLLIDYSFTFIFIVKHLSKKCIF